MKIFGKKIRELIHAKRLSQKEFCEKAGISTGTLHRILAMQTPDTLYNSTYRGIAIALDMTPQQLQAATESDEALAVSIAFEQPFDDARMVEIYGLFSKLSPARQQFVYDVLGTLLSRAAKLNGPKSEADVPPPRIANFGK